MDREISKKMNFASKINISFTKVRIRPRAGNKYTSLKKLEVKNVAVFWRHF